MSDKLLIFITGYLLLLYYYIWYIYVFLYFQNASLAIIYYSLQLLYWKDLSMARYKKVLYKKHFKLHYLPKDYLYILLVCWNFSFQSNPIHFYIMHVNNSYHEKNNYKQKLFSCLVSFFATLHFSSCFYLWKCESLFHDVLKSIITPYDNFFMTPTL